ncbi:hypothetical protein [Streptomyces sp. NPDC012888]|uniref:hypothetical protein n=1 Tax=Streptomyces sp. NPDC012888 TaxID=3364855 RepID=UPI0036B7542D
MQTITAITTALPPAVDGMPASTTPPTSLGGRRLFLVTDPDGTTVHIEGAQA